MELLVGGLGSMGKRRARLIRGVEPSAALAGVDFAPARREEARALGIEPYESIAAAVADFQTWQRKLGRDINPTELIARLREAGAKRVTLTAPVDTVIDTTELPKCTGATATYGGLEDD